MSFLLHSLLAKPDMVVCPNCAGDGVDGVDEEGKYYSCYRCGMSGLVSRASAEQEARDIAAYEQEMAVAAAAQRKAYGIPDGYGYYIDEVDGEVRLIPPRKQVVMADIDYSDDIPF